MSGICIWSSTMFCWRNRRVHHDGTSNMGGSLPMIIYTDTSQEEKKKKRGISSFWTAAASQLGRMHHDSANITGGSWPMIYNIVLGFLGGLTLPEQACSLQGFFVCKRGYNISGLASLGSKPSQCSSVQLCSFHLCNKECTCSCGMTSAMVSFAAVS